MHLFRVCGTGPGRSYECFLGSWAEGLGPPVGPIAFPLSVLPFLSEPLGPSPPRVQKHSLEVPRLVLRPHSTGVWLGPV